MGKATKNRNCGLCEKRRLCWRPERYGDRGELGKRPFPKEAVCGAFRLDKEFDRE